MVDTDVPITTTDVFIVGAGLIACTFARLLVAQGKQVILADAGGQFSALPGENLKNYANFQRDVDQFGHIVRGLMHPVSVPPAPNQAASTRNAINPRQQAENNLPGAVVAYAVGGMGIHWTCAIPRHHEAKERIPFIGAAEWNNLYTEAEELLNRHTDVHRDSLRQQVLKRILAPYGVLETPLAAERNATNPEFVHYTGADTVLGSLAMNGPDSGLTILREHRVGQLLHENGRVHTALVRDLQSGKERYFKATTFIVAAGWVHSAQLLWQSGIRPTALGKYLSDHTFAACQVALKPEILDAIGELAARQSPSRTPMPPDTLPVPMKDPAPHLYIPVSAERPWHSMIFREAFQFDPLPPDTDSRLVVDLKWFGMIEPVATNEVVFEDNITDVMGMPQPTFHFRLGPDDEARQALMLADMKQVAEQLGTYLPGSQSQPHYVPLGASTHTMGATRMGTDENTSVVDPYSRVWNMDNLYVGGNCVIPTANASNPTLTSVALAIRAARQLVAGPVPKVSSVR